MIAAKTGARQKTLGGAYDPETNLTFWGTGNPNPYFNGDMRAGDDLYSDSVIALDADKNNSGVELLTHKLEKYSYQNFLVPANLS